ncbi:hypothetical protein [Clostridium chromiireducens]|nr:hypothetical protein [Clostridium chromiireducens]
MCFIIVVKKMHLEYEAKIKLAGELASALFLLIISFDEVIKS